MTVELTPDLAVEGSAPALDTVALAVPVVAPGNSAPLEVVVIGC